jgi:Asp-tRNA(Asn)/Glu-tRNA(Gln) amidotransferase A subunit family amidase
MQARHALAWWLGVCDVLLTPSATGEAPEGWGTTGSSTFNRMWTLLGWPCVNVPGLVGEHGAPIGMQLIGRAAGALAQEVGKAAAAAGGTRAQGAGALSTRTCARRLRSVVTKPFALPGS